MDKDWYTLAFYLAPGIGPKRYLSLLSYFGTAEKAWEASEEAFLKSGLTSVMYQRFAAFREAFKPEEYVQKLQEAGITYIPYGDDLYPESLMQLEDPPICLFARGDTSLLKETEKNIAVVGSRKITAYGREVTRQFVEDLSLAGFTIVSGLALGVDGLAHQTALKEGTKTIAVLGCGVVCCYPREHQKLYDAILASGGLIVSEYPLTMQPNTGTFPARNRIITGISKAVLVTEAAEDSGALITARVAENVGKKVFAVPGPVTSRTSRGTIQLLKNGAILVDSGREMVKTLSGKEMSKKKLDMSTLSEKEKEVVLLLQDEERSIDDLSRTLKIPVTQLIVLLTGLQMKRIVQDFGQGMFGVALQE